MVICPCFPAKVHWILSHGRTPQLSGTQSHLVQGFGALKSFPKSVPCRDGFRTKQNEFHSILRLWLNIIYHYFCGGPVAPEASKIHRMVLLSFILSFEIENPMFEPVLHSGECPPVIYSIFPLAYSYNPPTNPNHIVVGVREKNAQRQSNDSRLCRPLIGEISEDQLSGEIKTLRIR